MTELEKMERARQYMVKLAQGEDPLTGQELPDDTVLNNVRLSRCFFYVAEVLGNLVKNGGQVSRPAKGKRTMPALTPEELSAVAPADQPLNISGFCRLVNDALGDEDKKITYNPIVQWLTEKGFLQTVPTENGRTRRGATEQSALVGIWEELRQGQNGSYVLVCYGPEAQRFLLDNLPAIQAWWNERQ